MNTKQAEELTGISRQNIRYYERQGVLYRIPRIGGRRDYSEKDYHRLQDILQLRRAGVPLKTICDYFALVDQGGQTAELRRAMLLEQRNAMVKQIADMQKKCLRAGQHSGLGLPTAPL